MCLWYCERVNNARKIIEHQNIVSGIIMIGYWKKLDIIKSNCVLRYSLCSNSVFRPPKNPSRMLLLRLPFLLQVCSGPFSCHSRVEVVEFCCFHVCVRCLMVLERKYHRGSYLHANPRNLFLCCIYRSKFSTFSQTFLWSIIQVLADRISRWCLMQL